MLERNTFWKRMRGTLFAVLVLGLSIIGVTSVYAATVVDSGSCGPALTYTLYDDGLLEIKGRGRMTDSPWAPRSVVEVKMQEGITTISDSAFWGCISLIDISIPDSMTKIGSWAFWGCLSLSNISIPVNIKEIDAGAFDYCTALESFEIPAGNSSIQNVTFRDCSSLTSITIPDSVTCIWSAAFEGCSSLAEITIPNNVEEIYNSAFKGCSSLTNITIPSKTTELGPSAFEGCSSLTSIIIPGSISNVWDATFSGCSQLRTATIKEGTLAIHEYAFEACTSLESITIPRSVVAIDKNAFSLCDALTIYGYAGSYAETYAKENNIPFIPIQPKKVTGIKLDKTSGKMLTATSALLPGQTETSFKLMATVSPADADNRDVKWTSSDDSIAIVDAAGKVKGLRAGTVTITATTVDGGKKATCKLQVMTRKEVALKAGGVYIFKSKLSNNYSMDVMYSNSEKNSNVSLYKTDTKRPAERFTVKSKKVNGKTCYLLTRKNSTVGSRAVTELKGKNLVFGTNKGTNWQLFRAYQFNDGTVQFINRGSNNAIAVVGGTAANRVNIAPAKADLSNGQRWKCVKVG